MGKALLHLMAGQLHGKMVMAEPREGEQMPLFIRVAQSTDGELRVLMAMGEDARPDDKLFAYIRTSNGDGGFIDGTDQKTGKRWGGYFFSYTYCAVPVAPDGDTMSRFADWCDWCEGFTLLRDGKISLACSRFETRALAGTGSEVQFRFWGEE